MATIMAKNSSAPEIVEREEAEPLGEQSMQLDSEFEQDQPA